jgi:hypothetical protein
MTLTIVGAGEEKRWKRSTNVTTVLGATRLPTEVEAPAGSGARLTCQVSWRASEGKMEE